MIHPSKAFQKILLLLSGESIFVLNVLLFFCFAILLVLS